MLSPKKSTSEGHHSKNQQNNKKPIILQRKGENSFQFNEAGKIIGQNFQTKLQVGEAGDSYEREADRVADKVVAKSESPSKGGDSAPVKTSKVGSGSLAQRMEKPVEEEVQLKSNDASSASSSKSSGGPNIAAQLASSKGSGDSMEKSTKTEMESGFGRDFDDVKIHTDSKASEMSDALNAKAFTSGNDIYFNKGQYSPESKGGKHLLAHELTHTLQQRNGGKMVQRAIEPEQVSQELIGKGFTLDEEFAVNFNSGKVVFPKWQFVNIVEWNNNLRTTRVSAYHKEKKKKYKFNILKHRITPYAQKKPGLYKYGAGLDNVKSNIARGKREIDEWKAGKSEYEKYDTMEIYNEQLANLEQLQTNRYEDLNRKLIQESMYNDFDASIKKWTDYYNDSIGESEGWSDLDANLVKSMIFQESQMGTAGAHLLLNPRVGSVKTRFNITQSVDSSGAILTLMIREMKPALYNKYDLDQVNKDLQKDKKRMSDLEKIKKSRELNSHEKADYNRIDRVAPLKKDGKSRYWDSYIRNHAKFKPAWKEFNVLGEGKERRNQYEFWIRAGVRWLFKKRESVSNWSEAIKAYNGSYDRAEYYRDNVVTRRNKAKTASIANKGFKPKLTY